MTTTRDSFLVGRDGEVSRIHEILDEVEVGRGRALLVEGEAGIGKSSLLKAAATTARGRGFRVFSAAADEFEVRRPFGVISDCLGLRAATEGPAAEVQQLITAPGDPTRSTEGPEREFQVVEAILDLVGVLEGDVPCLLVVDDLQWADPSSLLVVDRLVRGLHHYRSALLFAARPYPRSPELTAVLDRAEEAGVPRLKLGPLDEDEVVGLVTQLVDAEPGPNLIRQADAAAGNPLYLTELVHALEVDGAIRTEGGRAEVDAIGGPVPLPVTLLHRASFLPPKTVEVLSFASLIGQNFSPHELEMATGRPVVDLIAPIREALQAGVLIEHGERLTFRHDLIREALYSDLPASLRQAMHLQLARTFGDAGLPVHRVAEHVLRGAEAGDPEAVDWLHRSASEAAVTSPIVAVDLLERALELADPNHPARPVLLADLGLNLVWAGRSVQGEEVCRRALAAGPDPVDEARLRLALVQSLQLRGQTQEAVHEAAEAVSSPTLSRVDRARFQAWSTTARIFGGEFDVAHSLATEALEAAERVDDDVARCQALMTLSHIALIQADFAEAVEIGGRVVALAESSGSREVHRTMPHLAYGIALLNVGRMDEALSVLQRGRRVSEDFGVRGVLSIFGTCVASVHLETGRWDDCLTECQTALELSQETATGWLLYPHTMRALIALRRDELGEAQDALAAAESALEGTGGATGLERMLWAKALVLEAQGREDEAYEVLGSAWDLCEGIGLLTGIPLLGADAVRMALRAGDAGRAARVVSTLGAVAKRNPGLGHLRATSLRCQGLVSGEAAALVEAADALRVTGRPFDLACALEDAAVATAAAGEVEDALGLLGEALVVFGGLGARHESARAEARGREAGIRRGNRERRRRVRHGWEALTDTELKVLALVAERLTNPEIAQRLFVSRRTVQTHVSHLLAKLGKRSRLELAEEYRRRSA